MNGPLYIEPTPEGFALVDALADLAARQDAEDEAAARDAREPAAS